jgi:hypothetical protein
MTIAHDLLGLGHVNVNGRPSAAKPIRNDPKDRGRPEPAARNFLRHPHHKGKVAGIGRAMRSPACPDRDPAEGLIVVNRQETDTA